MSYIARYVDLRGLGNFVGDWIRDVHLETDHPVMYGSIALAWNVRAVLTSTALSTAQVVDRVARGITAAGYDLIGYSVPMPGVREYSTFSVRIHGDDDMSHPMDTGENAVKVVRAALEENNNILTAFKEAIIEVKDEVVDPTLRDYSDFAHDVGRRAGAAADAVTGNFTLILAVAAIFGLAYLASNTKPLVEKTGNLLGTGDDNE